MICEVHKSSHCIASRRDTYKYRGITLCIGAIQTFQIRGAETQDGKPVLLSSMAPRVKPPKDLVESI